MKVVILITTIFLSVLINCFSQSIESVDSFDKLVYQVKEKKDIDANLLTQYSGFKKSVSKEFPDYDYNDVNELLYINDSILALIELRKWGTDYFYSLWTFSETRCKIAELNLQEYIDIPISLPHENWYYEKINNRKYKIETILYRAKDNKYLNDDGSIKEEYISDFDIMTEEKKVDCYFIDDTGEIKKQ